MSMIPRPLLTLLCFPLLWGSALCLGQQNAGDADDNTSTAPPAAATGRDDRIQQLAASLPPEQVLWLTAGNSEFLAVQQRALQPENRGWVILLHASGQLPRWAGHLNHLQTTLPERGWSTLAITLPDPLAAPLPTRPTDAPQKPAGGNATDKSDPDSNTNQGTSPADQPDATAKQGLEREKQAAARISAALNHLGNDTPVALYGQGSGGARIAEYLATADRAPTAIILLNADNQTRFGEAKLPDALGLNPTLPTLDITSQPGTSHTIHVQARRDFAKRQGLENYQYSNLTPPTEAAVSRLVDGFLRRHTNTNRD